MSKKINRAPFNTPRTEPSSRAGNGDREKTATRLGQAFAQGYLAMHEYEDRVQAAFQAQTIGELHALLADLPVERIRRDDPARRAVRLAAARRGVRLHLVGYFLAATITIVVWTVVAVTTGAWYFWPIWAILGGAIGFTCHSVSVNAWARSGASARTTLPKSVKTA